VEAKDKLELAMDDDGVSLEEPHMKFGRAARS